MDIEVTEAGRKSNPLFWERVKVIRGEITDQDVDAIVSLLPANLEYRGALNKAILAAAGAQLDEFVLEHIYKPRPGDVYAVPGFDLPARHILFAVRPLWRNEFERHDRDLVNCVRKVMGLAQGMLLRRVAFPLLGSGRSGFPKPRAARLMLQTIEERCTHHFEEILLVAQDERDEQVFRERLEALR